MQHLNLYTQLEQKVELHFSAKHQTRIVLSIVALILAAYIALLVEKNSLDSTLSQLQQQQGRISSELEKQNLKKQRLLKNDSLNRELDLLKNDIRFRRKLLSNVDPDSAQGNNFSEHLSGLARQHIQGMWFTQIHLQSGGQQLALSGRTQQPEYVPQYLQKLANEKIFEGHQFRVFRMNTTKEMSGILDFELRATDVETQQ
ncbi:MAG: hypothetical protein JKY66_05785 [Spongiibacteraceae bacterium]|nr:hypothetical protein [Spongiibacteraceae bacterium]